MWTKRMELINESQERRVSKEVWEETVTEIGKETSLCVKEAKRINSLEGSGQGYTMEKRQAL